MKIMALLFISYIFLSLSPISSSSAQSIGTGISTTREEIIQDITSSGHSQEGYKRSIINQEKIEVEDKWLPTDYIDNDIKGSIYTIQLGDTLWEIAEGFYGDGARWGEILNNNLDKIGQFEDGSYGLIFPGDILNL